MNNKVTVTGMAVTTKVSSNLLIAQKTDSATTLAGTAKLTDDLFTNSLNQTVTGLLEPVSTIDGKNYYYTSTSNAAANGNAIVNEYIKYDLTADDKRGDFANNFEANYGTAGAVGYVDYCFQLKAVATADSYLDLSKLVIISSNSPDASKALRVAVFTEDITAGTATGAAGTLQAMFAVNGTSNQDDGEAVSDTSTISPLSLNYGVYADNTNGTIAKLSTGETKYYKVVVRLWLEGEDKTCTNDTYAKLTNNWKLELDFSLNTTKAPVSVITMLRTKAVTSGTYYYDGTKTYATVDDAIAQANGTAKTETEWDALT